MSYQQGHKLVILLDDPFEMWHPPQWFVPRLKKEFSQLAVAYHHDRRRDLKELIDADIMIGWSLTPKELRSAQALRWIYSITAGVDQFIFPELVSRNLQITSAGAVHGPVVAEHAIALVLALAKRLPAARDNQQQRKWAMRAIWDEFPRPRELRDAVLTVVGLGAIGSEIAALAAGLRMHVIGIREHPERGAAGAHEVLGFDAVDTAIARSDFIVLAAPASPGTHKMIDVRRLQLFQRHAYLINVARGALIDEKALVEALTQRCLAGAALDVFQCEPLPSTSPLWKMQQVLITPHTAFLSDKAWERHYILFSDNLRRYLAGQPVDAVEKGSNADK
jgi:D-2-hydroxyacid dehydrogenase (NADP+)